MTAFHKSVEIVRRDPKLQECSTERINRNSSSLMPYPETYKYQNFPFPHITNAQEASHPITRPPMQTPSVLIKIVSAWSPLRLLLKARQTEYGTARLIIDTRGYGYGRINRGSLWNRMVF